MSQQFTISDLVELLAGKGLLVGEPVSDPTVLSGFTPLSATEPGTLSWAREQPDWSAVKAAAVIVSQDADPPQGGAPPVAIVTSDPRLAFTLALRRFAVGERPRGIEDSARVGSGCEIDPSAYVGHHAVVGDEVQIGSGSAVGAQAVVGDRCVIGADCVVGAGSVIGSSGFGFERDGTGRWLRLPHIGRVVIGDRVEIGANTCIDRGTLGSTLIHDDVKIDNLCHIAHNVEIGANSLVIALAMIGGSTSIGEDAHIAPAAVLRNQLEIGDRSLVGLGAVVTKDVAAGDIVIGVPARSTKKD